MAGITVHDDAENFSRPLWPPDKPAYAHTPPETSPGRWHLWADHSRGAGSLAAEFAAAFDAGPLGLLLGLTHDAGKLAVEVQEALRSAAVDRRARLGVPHKCEGAGLAIPLLLEADAVGMWTMLLANMGHHHGIPDKASSEIRRIEQAMDRDRSRLDGLIARMDGELGVSLRDLAAEVEVPSWVVETAADHRSLEMFVRMLHSTLVDADYLDTEAHFKELGEPWRSRVRGASTLRDEFLTTYRHKYRDAADSEVNRLRLHYFEAAIAAGKSPRVRGGIYRLPAPTGTGKTMASAAFALEHAAIHRKRRVIVAVPFTSITTQNAEAYREMFHALGDDVVLEHHSNIIEDAIADDSWRRFSATNWDAEFVVTTTVQLFESLFSRRPSATRKLHRLVDSVIVIDEVQALPLQLAPAILGMLRELTEHYGVTVLLASATQPAFWDLPAWADLEPIDLVEMTHVPPVAQRVRYEVRDRQQPWGEIAAEIATEPQALIIVNTTTDAQTLHREVAALVPEGTPVRHLSTRMYSRHRAEVLAEVRGRLDRREPIVLVSTQVIEAGVDVDFPVVLRALAPAESIVQSAGRCNRGGDLGHRGGRVVVFRPREGGLPSGDYRSATRITESQFIEQPARAGVIDPGMLFEAPAQLTAYFQELYRSRTNEHAGLSVAIDTMRNELKFAETEATFQMIEETTVPVLIVAQASAVDRRRLEGILEHYDQDPTYFPSRSERRLLQSYTASAPRQAKGTPLIRARERAPLEWCGEYHHDFGLVAAVGEAAVW